MDTLIYHYNGQGLYKTSTIARMNPRRPDTPLIPAKATLIAPPTNLGPYTVARFDGSSWSEIPDYRGYHYFTPTEGEGSIKEADVSPPEGAIELVSGDKIMQDPDGSWRLVTDDDDLKAYKLNKINELKLSFSSEISVLDSGALGSTHKYDAEQHNIDWVFGCVMLTMGDDSKTPYITCDNLSGNSNSKQPRTHTKVQCAELLADCMDVVQTSKTKFRALRDEVNEAEDEDAVDAIVW